MIRSAHIVAAIGLLTGTAAGQSLTPALQFGVVDGTDFSSSTLADAVDTRFGDRRSLVEFDITNLDGPVITEALLTGTVNERFAFGFGTQPATLSAVVFGGNGSADLSDFAVMGELVGTIALAEEFDSVMFTIDIASALQAVADAGFDFVGVRFQAVEANVGQADVNDVTLEVTAVPTPAAAGLFAGAGAIALRRRR